ncbi:SGNH/GDSL hydrolase family protein [Dietzia maris]|uniref:SGNH/GDSL hydrolase family protein n=1 Tax=Dietzia maris TaxID=37915 RepID=UPI00223B4E75|nr:SGNH/GDSL hydrolase family protein [Dietzia maris]MCT1435098.1 SGNH/GDSL hydrolase family protein [Dietzia maris]MCT1521766.1 SGNH/GDSL hydrolase family protein [Dietzia maris]
MLTTPRRRFAGSRTLTTSLALAASVVLTAAPVAGAQSTTQADGTIALGSLGSSVGTPVSASGSLGSLSTPAYADYVALGDSYAAFGDQTEPVVTDGPAARCGRSLTNYPNVLDVNPAVGELVDVTCGGAIIPSLTGFQYDGVPAQLNALDAGTDLVTLSIGGNDVGFGTIVNCITKQDDYATVPSCREELDDEITAAIDTVFGAGVEEDVPVATKVDTIYALIAKRSPGATVVATQYLPLMPAEGESCAFTERLVPDDVKWAREVTAKINAAVNAAAVRNGHVSVLPVDPTVDRSACGNDDERWTDFTGGAPTGAYPMHPTSLGQQAMAQAIAAAI